MSSATAVSDTNATRLTSVLVTSWPEAFSRIVTPYSGVLLTWAWPVAPSWTAAPNATLLATESSPLANSNTAERTDVLVLT